MRDYFLTYENYRGPADETAAVEAAYAIADAAGLTYADLTAETPSAVVSRVFGAAVEAAWPNRIVSDPSHEGFLEVHPLAVAEG